MFFGMVWEKEGMNRKKSQRILEESVCSWEGKLLFFHVALNTVSHLAAVAGLFNICNKGDEVLPEIV